MPVARYIRVTIDGQLMDMEQADQMPVTITYSLEDPDNFQNKTSSVSFDIKFPATPTNDRISNTFHDPSIEDMTEDGEFRSNRSATIEANGYELLVGKAFLTSATHNYRPLEYEYSFYGNNADWLIDLKETTLFDLVNHINFPFTKQTMVDSWQYNGWSESLPYVFAPVRYSDPMDEAENALISVDPPVIKDYSMKPEYMKPAISLYWIIYWAFKSVGYKIISSFFDTDYFRRAVMPWTWGSFQSSQDTRLDNLRCSVKSEEAVSEAYRDVQEIWDLNVTNDNKDGAFNNNSCYSYDFVNKEMKWTYLPGFDYGLLEAHFMLKMQVHGFATSGINHNGHVTVRVQWFKNGDRITTGQPNENADGDMVYHIETNIGKLKRRVETVEIVEDHLALNVKAGEEVTAKVYLDMDDTTAGSSRVTASVEAFELQYFRIVLGSTVDFQNYTSFKNFKFIDLLAGTVDLFNLSIQADSINKQVIIEPTHPYSLSNDFAALNDGYFKNDFLKWDQKQDLSEESTMQLFNDYEKEVMFKLKDDDSDGMLKTIQDRYNITLAAGKYVFPDRFKADKKEIENRFFSAVMHYGVTQWEGLGSPGIIPQMICLVPENISNTSADEAGNTFGPKLAWYKGIIDDTGWIFDKEHKTGFPFMFAVNYREGGENDPIFSYSDERIGKEGDMVIGKGLLRRFYLQRLAIMRNGQYYDTSFLLNNLDITNWFHREHIICRGQRWELVQISNYAPLLNKSTKCTLRKWSPIIKKDSDNVFPSNENVSGKQRSFNQYDIKYAQLLGLSTDIPNAQPTTD